MKNTMIILALAFSAYATAQQKTLPKVNTERSEQTTESGTFYKNVDSAKASHYRMLSKKPDGEFLELSATEKKRFPAEVRSDSLRIKKKNK